jgi:hypothetical protein
MSRLGKKVNLVNSIEIEEIPIRRDSFLPNAYVIELPLDAQPDYVWQTLFDQEWRSSLHLWERKVVVVGNKVLLITTPEGVAEKIAWLRKIIEATNKRVEKFNQTQRIIEDAAKGEGLREHENVIRDALRMTFAIR